MKNNKILNISQEKATDPRIIQSAFAYRYLVKKWCSKTLSLESILKRHPAIGLIGPGNGIVTKLLDGSLNKSRLFCTHAILHDAMGRVYLDYKVGPGYCYAFYDYGIPEYFKSLSVLGHLTGLVLCFRHPLDIF